MPFLSSGNAVSQNVTIYHRVRSRFIISYDKSLLLKRQIITKQKIVRNDSLLDLPLFIDLDLTQ